MSVVHLSRRSQKQAKRHERSGRVYAIAFDIDTKAAERELGPTWRNCYGHIGAVFAAHGFKGQQGSLYFGPEGSNPVHCVLAVQEVDRKHPWFARIVRDLRMLRVEEQNDLMDALSNELRFDYTAPNTSDG